MDRHSRDRTHLPKRHSDLPPSFRSLFATMRKTGFGRIRKLSVVNGEPILEPAPLVEEDYRFGRQTGIAAEPDSGDFVLKDAQVDLVRKLREVGSGTVRNVEFKGGLPLKMTVDRAS